MGSKENQFVVEDNGVLQTAHLDVDTDSLGLSLVVVVQCSRSAGWEFPKLNGLGTMIDAITGDAPREVAIVTYASAPLLLGKFSNNMDSTMRALTQLEPCDDDPDAATLDAVDYAARLPGCAEEPLSARDSADQRDARSWQPEEAPRRWLRHWDGRIRSLTRVAFGPGKTEVLNDLKYGGGSGPIGLLVMAENALKKNAAKELAALSGGEYINFTTQKGFDGWAA